MQNHSIQRQVSIKDIYAEDSVRVAQIAEEKIKDSAYRFALQLKTEFKLSDLEPAIQNLALEVRALDMVESGLQTMLEELNQR